MRSVIDSLIDRVNSPRFLDSEYYEAINLATVQIFEDRVDNIKIKKNYSFESVQRVRDELYTLIKTSTGAPAADVIPYPTDYNYTIDIQFTVGTVTQSARPLSYNEVGLLARNPFKQLSPEMTYYIEQSNGLLGKYAGGTFSAYNLTYLKNPAQVSIGKESDKIGTGGTLTNTVIYIAYEQSVYNGTIYYAGDLLTGTGAALTSGVVIQRNLTADSDMPDKIHPEICRQAASILSADVADYQKKQSLLQDNNSQ